MFLTSLLFSIIAGSILWLVARRNPAVDPRLTVIILVVLMLLPLASQLPQIPIKIASPGGLQSDRSNWIWPAIWASGFLLFGLRGLRDVLAIQRWRRAATEAPEQAEFQALLKQLEMSERVDLRTHPQVTSPVVTGLIRPTILLPEGAHRWSSETRQLALLHELGHIQRRDLWMAAFAHLVCVFHWFNPAVWWMRRSFLNQCEFACDAHLLNCGADPGRYAHALCDVAQSARALPLTLAMAGHVPLRERILLLSPKPARGSVLLTTLIAISAGVAMALSFVKFVPQEEDQAEQAPEMNEVDLRFTADPFPAD